MNQVQVTRYRCPLPRSAKGVMVESIDSPHGDHVERAAAAPPTRKARTVSVTVIGLLIG
jgi:hypothetical protein